MSPGDCVVAGHFGEWLQGRLGPGGPVVLVTLPCPALTVRATSGSGATSPKVFSEARLRQFLACLDLPADALPAISCAMPPGAGAGASTATLVALARWFGFEGPPEDLARACLATEGATDPLMWPEPDRLIWASREARIIRRVAAPPASEIVGGFWGDPVATDASDCAFDDITDLVEDWSAAVDGRDLHRIARLASRSSDRCSARRGPIDPMPDLARDLRAIGYVRAHTGSARGLIFAPGTVTGGWQEAMREAGLTGLLRFRTGATP